MSEPADTPPAPENRPLVDYSRDADRYHRGRQLSPQVMGEWASAVEELASSGGRVLDLGAGTRIFTSRLGQWTRTQMVVALDRSEAMLAQEVSPIASGSPRSVGEAESLPLRSASMEVVWMSAVYLHFADKHAVIAEVARVLTADGVVLVRTLLRDRCGVPWLDCFPPRARTRALARFPSADELRGAWGVHGFSTVADLDIDEGTHDGPSAARWIQQMRDRDTLLAAVTDDEITGAISALATRTAPLEARLSLLAFSRTDGRHNAATASRQSQTVQP